MKSAKYVTKQESPWFQEAWDLYISAFPKEERRTLACQQKIMNNPAYNFEVLLKNKTFAGILLWWKFEDIRFIEHLAIPSSQRNKGLGRYFVEQFLKRNYLPVILEVELPEDELKQRRIQFYKRLGFNLNPHFYQQPPIRKGCEPLELRLMSYPSPLIKEAVNRFTEKRHPVIYG